MRFELCILNKQAFGDWYLQITKDGEVVQVLKLSEEQALYMVDKGVNHQG